MAYFTDGGGGSGNISLEPFTTVYENLPIKQYYLNHPKLVDVRPFQNMFPHLMKKVSNWIVKRTISPFEFYLELALGISVTDDKVVPTYLDWSPKMKSFYNEAKNQSKCKIVDKWAIREGFCYVYQDVSSAYEDEISWHRVRVLTVNNEEDEAKVFFCDLGRLEYVQLSDLFYITPEWAKFEAQVLRCYLSNILPITAPTTGGLNWSTEACSFFKEMMSERSGPGYLIRGIVVSKTDSELRSDLPEVIMDLGMVLFDRHQAKEEPPCTLNCMLVKEGLAISSGLFSCCPHQLQDCDVFNVNKLVHSLAEDERKKHDAEAPNPYAPEEDQDDWSAPFEFGSEATMPPCPTPSNNPDLVFPDNYRPFHLKKTQAREVSNNEDSSGLPEAIKRIIAHVTIQYVKGPSHIIVNLQRDMPAIKVLGDAIRRSVEAEKPLSVEDIQTGQFVAFSRNLKVQEEVDNVNKAEKITTKYHRGLILSKENDNCFNVISVDHGVEVIITTKSIFKLDESFLKIPSFAVRLHLEIHGMVPVRNEKKWSDEMNTHFLNYLLSWQFGEPNYFIYRPFGSQCIVLDYVSQEIIFDRGSDKWIADPAGPKDKDEEEEYQNIFMSNPVLKNHPLLKPLTRSIGVVIKYEIESNVSTNFYFWQFGWLHDEIYKNSGEVDKEYCKIKRDPLSMLMVDSRRGLTATILL